MTLTQEQIDCVNKFRDRQGKANARDIVEEARKKSSVLNSLFDWDLKRVHERYLLARAEEIVRSCPVEVKIDDITVKIPRYRHDPDPDAPTATYVDITMATREKNEQVLDGLMSRIANLVTDAKNHAAVSDLSSEFAARLTEITEAAIRGTKKRPGRPPKRKGEDRPSANA